MTYTLYIAYTDGTSKEIKIKPQGVQVAYRIGRDIVANTPSVLYVNVINEDDDVLITL